VTLSTNVIFFRQVFVAHSWALYYVQTDMVLAKDGRYEGFVCMPSPWRNDPTKTPILGAGIVNSSSGLSRHRIIIGQ
jgi:hypothetical protein